MNKKLRHLLACGGLLSIALYAPNALADLYKCTVNGKVQYQQMACSAGEEKALDDSSRRMRQRERDAKEQLANAEKNALNEKSGAVPKDDADRRIKAEKAMRSYFDQTLIDPSSAQYRNIKIYLDVPGSKLRKSGSKSTPLVDVVCGEVNSKNRMGGYVGYRQFYWDSDEKKAVGPNDDKDFGPIMQALATSTCADLG